MGLLVLAQDQRADSWHLMRTQESAPSSCGFACVSCMFLLANGCAAVNAGTQCIRNG